MGFQLIPPLYTLPAYYADLPGRRFYLSAYYGQPSACVYAPTDPVYWEVFYTNKRPITFCPPLLSYTKTHQRLLSFMSPGVPWQSIPLSSVSVIIPCEYLNTIMWIETHQSYLEPSFMLVSFVNILRPWCDEWSTVIHMALGHTLRFNWKNYMSLKTKGYHITCNEVWQLCTISVLHFVFPQSCLRGMFFPTILLGSHVSLYRHWTRVTSQWGPTRWWRTTRSGTCPLTNLSQGGANITAMGEVVQFLYSIPWW